MGLNLYMDQKKSPGVPGEKRDDVGNAVRAIWDFSEPPEPYRACKYKGRSTDTGKSGE